jgi:hypothetical protein
MCLILRSTKFDACTGHKMDLYFTEILVKDRQQQIADEFKRIHLSKVRRKKGNTLMKWAEVIVLRAAGSNREALESKLRKLIGDVEKEKKREAINVYSRVLIDTDFCIRITHSSNQIKNGGSKLGLRIVSALKEFGLVNHSIWTEMPGKQ